MGVAVYLSRTEEIVVEQVAVKSADLNLTPIAAEKYPVKAAAIRVIDCLIAGLALIAAAPLMVLIAVLVTLEDGGPILFGQHRLGLGGRTFRCWKFRTMVVDAEARLAALLASDPAARREWDADHKLRKDPRITPLGQLLRVSSIDELPQLINVLAGEMSLVGPRPIVQAEVARYGRWYRHYCASRPGITGVWQVSGRNDVSYDRRVAMDVFFAQKKSVKVYFSILLATVPSVLFRTGSY
jgi:lipopolysaccharide/colanic/teichoic acid biosynthesis glycosyltransferase